MPATHTADFQTAAVKATNLDAVEQINVGIETDKVRKHLNIVAATPEIRIQDKTGSAPEVTATTMAIVAEANTTHFRAGTSTFAEGAETKGNVKFQSSTGATTHAEIVGSSGKLELQDGGLGLKRGSNVSVSGTPSAVIQEITGPHARESAVLKKYPEVPLASNVQSGYVIEASSEHSSGTYPGWNAFNGVVETTNGADGEWISGAGKYNTSATNGAYLAHSSNAVLFQGARGEYLGIVLPHRIKVKYVSVYGRPDSGSPRTVREYRLWGSNDGSTWNQLQTGTNTLAVPASTNKFNITVDATTAYSRYRLQALSMNTGEGGVSIGELEYYGYEEVGAGDDSVDTTVKSVYNAPDLTSAALYIDANVTGTSVTDQSGSTPSVTVTATGVTYDSTEKAWTLTGAATSNIVSGDLTSLVGDHPHSVSAWVKADQLNGDGLFHVGTADGAGDAASRVGFVDDSHISWGGEDHYFSNAEWHNVTYTYNGEGSDKKLYLDGRRVGTAKNEDTFGDYPPFAMTTYSQYGYTVSSSGNVGGNGDARIWLVFNNSTSDFYGFGAHYDNTTGDYTRSPASKLATTDIDGNSIPDGEFLKLEVPHKLLLQYITMSARTGQTNSAPRLWRMYGSNDDTNWKLLRNKTASTVPADTAGTNYTINASKGYKYFALVVTQSGGYTYCNIAELKYFGHHENDLVRFPDSVNTLKYPHVAMTGPARRGYAVTVSTQSTDSLTDPWRAFDGDTNTFWKTLESFTGGVYQQSNKLTDTTPTDHDGEYIILETPRKIQLSKVEINAQNSGRQPNSIAILGSNNGSATTGWALLAQQTSTTYASNETSITVSSATSFKYHALVVRSLLSSSGVNPLMIQELRFFGTDENSDVIARVGDGFDGKVRNLRVYSTALSDARVQEIFDADKDEFGLAKSSVSVYRGHLGVGTTEPKAALTVMDEVGELQEFPPRACGFDGDEWYIDGHGTFRANASNYHSSTDFAPGRAFTKSLITNFGYASQASNSMRWEGNGGLPNPSPTSGFVPVGIFEGRRGDWLELELPYRIYVKKFQIQTRLWSGSPRDHPKNGALYGSNDRNTWTELTEFTNLSYTPSELDGIGGHTANWTVNSTSSYKYLRLLTTQKIDGTDDWLMISELRYFGTREQGASTLHNGELSLTRNLTVPRIGPPLDADDTPRRDRLVVEYNTSTNPTENGFVKDTSGLNGDSGTGTYINGKIWTSTTYDLTEKAFSLTAPWDGISSKLPPSLSGNHPYSFSIWVKPDTIQSGNVALCEMGQRDANQSFGLYVNGGVIVHLAFGNNLQTSTSIAAGQWTHIVGTYVSGSRRTYANGVLIGSDTYSSLDISHSPRNISVCVGASLDVSAGFGGFISQFKLYDVALTGDEVKRLYDMGRCDEGHHVVNFSKTRVGIGLGDGEAPQAPLEVRDVARFDQIDIHHDNEKDTVINFRHYDSGGNIKPWEIGQIMGVNPTGANNSDFKFAATNRVVKAWIDSSTSAPTTEINNFTGQHRTFIKDIPFSQAEDLEGLIVSSDQNKYIKMSGGIEVGSNAITTNESLPVVSISNVASDKRCFGVISASEDPETRQDRHGNIFSVFVKEKGDTRVYINSVGEGAIWVVNANGSLESGDYITTSNIAGYGQKQDGAGLMNYTVAKITMDCDFEPATQPIQRIKQSNVVETHYTGLVQVAKSVPHEFVTTVVSADDAWSNVSISSSDVTYAEWSNLESNVQNTYTLEYTSTSNVVYDVKYTKTTTANVTVEDAWDAVHVDPPTVTYAEYSNLEADVQNTYSLTFTRTTTEEKTPEEWSALDANAQALWSIQYYDTVEQIVDADYPDAVAHDTVTDKLENDLDEHGQIQWEDTEETEKAYKIRYLDASGQQTDEANAIHSAAFVGCTYHCG